MAIVQVILSGEGRMTIHDTFDYPLVLQFGDQKLYEHARWFIPACPAPIPTYQLSEIRVDEGPLSVMIDGPEGFRSGPHPVTWIRGYYPRGKHCSLLSVDPDTMKVGGVTITIYEETLIVDEFSPA